MGLENCGCRPRAYIWKISTREIVYEVESAIPDADADSYWVSPGGLNGAAGYMISFHNDPLRAFVEYEELVP